MDGKGDLMNCQDHKKGFGERKRANVRSRKWLSGDDRQVLVEKRQVRNNLWMVIFNVNSVTFLLLRTAISARSRKKF